MVSVATPNCSFFLLEKIADPGVRALNPPPPPTPDIRNQGPGPGTAPGTRSRWSGTPGDQESPGPGPPGGHRSPGPRTPGGCRRHRVRHPGVRESPGPPPRFWQLASRGKKNNLCRQQPKVRRTLPLPPREQEEDDRRGPDVGELEEDQVHRLGVVEQIQVPRDEDGEVQDPGTQLPGRNRCRLFQQPNGEE